MTGPGRVEPVTWDDLAEWYDRKQGEDGDLWHRALIDPALLRRVGDVRGRDVLDLGCGNGYLARRLQRSGARVTGIDRSRGMVEAARRHEAALPLGIRYLEADAGSLGALPSRSFDLVLANMVLMDLADPAAALREVGRLLRAFGRFVASTDHPCFGGDAGARWIREGSAGKESVARRIDRYRGTFDDPGVWNGPEGRTMSTPAYHRPLSWYADRLREAGLAITALDEPEPTEEFHAASPLAGAIAAIPLHVVLEALRLPGPPGPG